MDITVSGFSERTAEVRTNSASDCPNPQISDPSGLNIGLRMALS